MPDPGLPFKRTVSFCLECESPEPPHDNEPPREMFNCLAGKTTGKSPETI